MHVRSVLLTAAGLLLSACAGSPGPESAPSPAPETEPAAAEEEAVAVAAGSAT